MPKNIFILFSLLNDHLAGYRILDLQLFLLGNVTNVIPLSSGFYQDICYWCNCHTFLGNLSLSLWLILGFSICFSAKRHIYFICPTWHLQFLNLRIYIFQYFWKILPLYIWILSSFLSFLLELIVVLLDYLIFSQLVTSLLCFLTLSK